MRRERLPVVCMLVIFATFLFGCGQGPAQHSERVPNSQPSTDIVNKGRLVELPEGKVEREIDADVITPKVPVEVIENTLVVTQITSAYAHGQHLVYVDGKLKKDVGELFLTLQDTNGEALQSSLASVERVEPADGDWLEFSHKLVEDVLPLRDDIDQGVIVFQLQKDGHVILGKLLVPLRKPPIVINPKEPVIVNKLVVAQIVSDYAHSQHIVEVYGKVKKDAGDLFLTLQDTNGKSLQSSLARVEHVQPADGDWLAFAHKLVEPFRDHIDQGVIVFQLRKDGRVTQGKLVVPLKKPPTE